MDSWFCLVWQSLRYWLIGWAVLLRSLSRKLGMSVLGELWNDVFLFLSLVLFHFFLLHMLFHRAYRLSPRMEREHLELCSCEQVQRVPSTQHHDAVWWGDTITAPILYRSLGTWFQQETCASSNAILRRPLEELEEPAQRARVHWGRSSSMSRWTRDSTGLQSKCKCEINI